MKAILAFLLVTILTVIAMADWSNPPATPPPPGSDPNDYMPAWYITWMDVSNWNYGLLQTVDIFTNHNVFSGSNTFSNLYVNGTNVMNAVETNMTDLLILQDKTFGHAAMLFDSDGVWKASYDAQNIFRAAQDATEGDTVYIAPGRYRPDGGGVWSFPLAEGVRLIGAGRSATFLENSSISITGSAIVENLHCSSLLSPCITIASYEEDQIRISSCWIVNGITAYRFSAEEPSLNIEHSRIDGTIHNIGNPEGHRLYLSHSRFDVGAINGWAHVVYEDNVARTDKNNTFAPGTLNTFHLLKALHITVGNEGITAAKIAIWDLVPDILETLNTPPPFTGPVEWVDLSGSFHEMQFTEGLLRFYMVTPLPTP
jgi:hypothetical protein